MCARACAQRGGPSGGVAPRFDERPAPCAVRPPGRALPAAAAAAAHARRRAGLPRGRAAAPA
eukprot:scaffold7430_cov60-Phaeocystis_antarctica.AAC.1